METLIIFAAQHLIWVMVAIAVLVIGGYIYKHRASGFLLQVIASGALAFTASRITKLFYHSPRPFVSDEIVALVPHIADNGFPSDHTLLAAVLAFLVLRISKLWGSVLLFLTLAVGLGRVGAYVHSPIDVIGSFVIAGTSVFAIAWLFRRFVKSGEKPA